MLPIIENFELNNPSLSITYFNIRDARRVSKKYGWILKKTSE